MTNNINENNKIDKDLYIDPLKKDEINQIVISEIKNKILKYQKKIISLKNTEEQKIKSILNRNNSILENTYKYSLEKFILSLLPTVDNLERALIISKNSSKELNEVITNIKKVLQSLVNLIKKFNVSIIDKINVPFDPLIHQAMLMQYSDTCPKNHVIMVMQKGYILHDRLLRAALVIVSSGKKI
ncbi:Protein GrpE [Buchnera aphidicola (Thelaxes suberi)]|uniref:nucleotide exchange factor GrpE n=1 Tax=Buchnera aphidicola TaxID=9 RepID=UPI0034646414